MVRALICSSLFLVLACSSAPVLPADKANPNLLDQKLLSDVVAAAFARIDGLNLRRHVNGKNVAVQVATTYPTETSMVRVQAGLLLTRAGAVRADLQRGGDLVALIVLRAYGTQAAEADDGTQQRAFMIGDLILSRPGRGEVYREALAAKAVDHYFSDGTRERRNVGRRAEAQREPAPEPDPEPEPEPEPMAEAELDLETEPEAKPRPSEEPRRARSERREPRESRSRSRTRTPEKKRRRAKKKEKRKAAEQKEAKESDKRKRNRRRRRRQPLILE
jgi:hypothetical protein